MSREPDLEFKFRLLLAALPVPCRYFKGKAEFCSLSEEHEPEDEEDENTWNCHVACKCNGNIDWCDLPDIFQPYLV